MKEFKQFKYANKNCYHLRQRSPNCVPKKNLQPARYFSAQNTPYKNSNNKRSF